MLEVRDLRAAYGVTPVLHGVELRASASSFLGIIGRNGAGKSTTLRCIVGLMQPSRGAVLLDDEPIVGRPTHEIARRGVAFVPENRGVFPSLTVMESLTLGQRPPPAGSAGWTLERVLQVFPRLGERSRNRCDALSGGEQQMLAIGRALMARPRLLLLDEPSMGLAPIIVQDIFRTLQRINAEGLTIFLVEQNVKQALKLAQHAYVIENGRIVLQGSGGELLGDPRVQAAYLGH